MNAETFLVIFLTFLSVAVFVAYIARRLRVPYTIAMVLAGVGVTLLQISPGEGGLELEPELILLIFLPGLLFEASYHIDLHQLRENLRPILLLAIPGILLSTLVLGFLLNVGLGITIVEALLFAVLISATDPIAVVALFKEFGVDKRLGIIIEGESLFNDGVAIVLYTILAGIAAGTSVFSLSGTIVDFVVTVVGGAALGLLVGFLFTELMRRSDDPLIDIALTAILAYGLYLFAEETLHGVVSPVIAVVVAGITVGNYGASGRHSATASNMIVTFWEFIAFLINSAVFLLIGLEVELDALLNDLGLVLLTILAVLVARAVVVYSLRLLINRKPPKLSLAWGHVMFWGGMRGAVSIALVLSLPLAVGSRDLFVTMAFGYVIFSVIVQGLSIGSLLDRLGLTRRTDKQIAFESKITEMALAEAAGEAVEALQEEHILSKAVTERVKTIVDGWLEEHQNDLRDLVREEPGLAETNRQMMMREIGYTQKQTLRRLLRRGIISEEVFETYNERLDERFHGGFPEDGIFSQEALDKLGNLQSEASPAEKAGD